MNDLQVVDVHVEHFDGLKLASLWVLEVQSWGPVVTLVILDQGRSTGRLEGLVVGHAQSERVPTLDSVNMARRTTGVDNGVHAAHDKRTLAIEMVDCECTLVGRVSRSRCGAKGQESCL